MSESSEAPNGGEVVQTGVIGGGFFSQFGGIVLDGLSRRIDLELTSDAGRVNTDDYYAPPVQPTQPAQSFSAGGIGDVFANLTPVQIGGLFVAAALSFALVTGKFAK